MQIKSQFTDLQGKIAQVTYQDADSFEHLSGEKVTQSYGVCFLGDKMVIVYSSKYKHWTMPGGSIEKGESYEECLRREIQEESNMKVLALTPIGYQEVHFEGKIYNQLRYVCLVGPYGDFVSDPDGSVNEVKIADPKECLEHLDWGEIGERLVTRALELKSKLVPNPGN